MRAASSAASPSPPRSGVGEGASSTKLRPRQLGLRQPRPPHDGPLLQDRQRVVPAPVDHQPGREAGQHEGEDDRHELEDLRLHRVRRRRVELLLEEHRAAHDQRPQAEMQEVRVVRRVPRDQAEQGKDVGRIDRRQVVDPAEERRVPHLDGHENDLVEREEHRDLHDHGQAAAGRVHLLGLVELHDLGLHLLRLVL